MKQRQLTDVKSDREIKQDELTKRKKLLKEKKENITPEDLMKSIICSINSLKESIEDFNNVPDETLNLLHKLILVLDKKQVNINFPEKRMLKSVTPTRDKNGVAVKYDFVWED